MIICNPTYLFLVYIYVQNVIISVFNIATVSNARFFSTNKEAKSEKLLIFFSYYFSSHNPS